MFAPRQLGRLEPELAFRRSVFVPVDALILLGQVVEVDAFTPAQLWQLPTHPAGTAAPLSPDATIKVGFAKPSH